MGRCQIESKLQRHMLRISLQDVLLPSLIVTQFNLAHKNFHPSVGKFYSSQSGSILLHIASTMLCFHTVQRRPDMQCIAQTSSLITISCTKENFGPHGCLSPSLGAAPFFILSLYDTIMNFREPLRCNE